MENGGKRIFTRSINHLVPLELPLFPLELPLVPLELHLNSDIKESANHKDIQLCQHNNSSEAREMQACVRPRHTTAVIGELLIEFW